MGGGHGGGGELQDSECLGNERAPHKDSDLLIYSGEQPRSQFN